MAYLISFRCWLLTLLYFLGRREGREGVCATWATVWVVSVGGSAQSLSRQGSTAKSLRCRLQGESCNSFVPFSAPDGATSAI